MTQMKCTRLGSSGVIVSRLAFGTKPGLRQGEAITGSGLSRRHIMRQVEKSLLNLDTDVIDLLIVHKPDFTIPVEETQAVLNNPAPPHPTYPDGMMGMLTDQAHKAALQ